MQQLGVVIETVSRGVQRQQVAQIHFDAKQISHGVCILRPIQAPHHHAALRFPAGDLCFFRLCADPVHHALHVLHWRTRLIPRRHIALLELRQYSQPLLAVLLVAEIIRQTRDSEGTLRIHAGVTLLAMLSEQLLCGHLCLRSRVDRRNESHDDAENVQPVHARGEPINDWRPGNFVANVDGSHFIRTLRWKNRTEIKSLHTQRRKFYPPRPGQTILYWISVSRGNG